jgi:hypothetical protein
MKLYMLHKLLIGSRLDNKMNRVSYVWMELKTITASILQSTVHVQYCTVNASVN